MNRTFGGTYFQFVFWITGIEIRSISLTDNRSRSPSSPRLSRWIYGHSNVAGLYIIDQDGPRSCLSRFAEELRRKQHRLSARRLRYILFAAPRFPNSRARSGRTLLAKSKIGIGQPPSIIRKSYRTMVLVSRRSA